MSFPIISGYLNERIPSARRATILSFYQLSFSLVIAFVEPLRGFIADVGSLPAAYRTAGVLLAILGAPLFVLWLRSTRDEQLLTQPAGRVTEREAL
jgi:MFS family permease